MLEAGAEAPHFELPGVHEGTVRAFSLSSYVGDAVVVLCFYPAAFGPHCAPGDCWLQAVDLLDLQRNVAVLAVGPDTAFAQRAFARRANLDVPLLADTAGDVAADYGVVDDYEGHEGVPRRSVFVLDDRGVVRYAWAAADRDERPDVEEIKAAIDGVKSDDSALARYRRAHDYSRYGESEFAIASEAFEETDWQLAAEAFAEARRYFEHAGEAADRAHWFAASDDLAADLRDAKDRIDHLARAAKWFAESARRYAGGQTAAAAELRQDAARQRERADEHGPLPAPGDLAPDGEPVEA